MIRKTRTVILIAVVSVATIFSFLGSGYRGNQAPNVVDIRELAKPVQNVRSPWDGRTVAVEGYWESHFDGLSIKAALSADVGEFLLVRPISGFHVRHVPLARFVPQALRPEPMVLKTGDYIRMNGVFHESGYRPGSLLEECAWLEFSFVEVWDGRSKRWRAVDYYW